jgi:hypothetical protein
MATMAASHMHPSLEVAAPDDDMEISSDAGRMDNYDIDIDLMDPQDDDPEIDYMLEDDVVDHAADQDVHASSRDDVMADDMEDSTIVEDIMRDDDHVQDDYLADINEPPADGSLHHFDHQHSFHEQEYTQPDLLQDLTEYKEEHVQVPEIVLDDTTQQTASPVVAPSVPIEDGQPLQPSSANPFSLPPSENEPSALSDVDYNLEHHVGELEGEAHSDNANPDDAGSPHDETQVENSDGLSLLPEDSHNTQDSRAESSIESELPTGSPTAQEQSPPSPQPRTTDQETLNHIEHQIASSQEEQNIEDVDDTPYRLQLPTQADGEQELQDDSTWNPSLHAVKVQYATAQYDDDDSDSLFLFPAHSGSFVVEDTSLAYKSMSELFQSCRQTLSDVSEDEELEIYCEDLDLCISEVCIPHYMTPEALLIILQDSKHCATTSFSQIIDVYIQLQQHDGVEQPPALRISIRTKPRFSTQLEALFTAASEDKGLSQLHINNSIVPRITHTASTVDNTRLPETQVQLSQTELAATEPAGLNEQTVGDDLHRDETESSHVDVYQESDEGVYEHDFELEEYPDEATGEIGETEELTAYPDEGFVPGETSTYVDENAEYEDPTFIETQDPGTEAILEDHSHNEVIGAPEEDVESSGSSTVQGENDVPHNCQYSCALEPYDLLTQYEDSALDDSSDQQASAPEHVDSEDVEYSGDHVTAYDEDENATAHPLSEGLSLTLTAETEDGASETQTQHLEDPAYALEQADQEWDPVGYEDGGYPDEQSLDDSQQEENDGEVPSADAWDGFADQDEPVDHGKPEDVTDLNAAIGSSHSAPGTFQVPDESAEEDEDSITYDDEPEEESLAEPAVTTSQARSSDSPLGKRSREDDHESGGEDGSDQGQCKRVCLDGDFTHTGQIRSD